MTTYKVWVEIERCDEDGYEDAGEPEPIGEFYSLDDYPRPTIETLSAEIFKRGFEAGRSTLQSGMNRMAAYAVQVGDGRWEIVCAKDDDGRTIALAGDDYQRTGDWTLSGSMADSAQAFAVSRLRTM